MKLCQGLNVGGHTLGIGCPHEPGDCLLNEEFHLGFCYKKCAVLTDAAYPFRATADSCCKANDYIDCLDPANLLTNTSFSVGGGSGDAELEDPAGEVHAPIAALAEDQATTTALLPSALQN